MNIQCIKENWILSRMGYELRPYERLFERINYAIPYSQYKKTDGIDVALFTHFDPNKVGKFIETAKSCDAAICMSRKTAKDVARFRNNHIYVIEGGTDMPKKKLKFGVVGRVYPGGRKGEYLIAKMVAEGYDITALGQGWPCQQFAEDNTNEDYGTATREKFYSQIDYLIIPSLIEGGPIPFIDALAYGVPVIAPDVGWCWDYSCIHYEKGNWDSLNATLKGLNPPSWEDWVHDHLTLFERLENEIEARR